MQGTAAGDRVTGMRRPLRISLLALLTLAAASTTAHAAKPKLSPDASAVSDAGVATIEAANPTRYALRGTATVTVGGRTILSRSVRLGRRAVGVVTLRFGARDLEALRAAGGRATITLKLKRAGARRAMTAKRTVTLALPASGVEPAASPAPAAPAAPAVPSRWVGRMGSEGPYDDFEITTDDGRLTFTKAPFVAVSCMEGGGAHRIALSLELFGAQGPFPIGGEHIVEHQQPAVNTLVTSGARTIKHKVSEAAQTPTSLTGKLTMSFMDSRLDIFNNYAIVITTCAGTQSFEAIPAG